MISAMSDVMDQLNEVVTKSELADMMNSFVNDEDNGWLLYNTKYCSADAAYSSVYGQAKKSVQDTYRTADGQSGCQYSSL